MSGDLSRFSRQLALRGFGAAAQEKLSKSRVLLVGLGGLGSPAAAYLAAAGVGQLIINDFDTVHLSNLHRQILYVDKDLGARKINAAGARLKAINPVLRLTLVDQRLDRETLADFVDSADLVLDGTDNFASREGINAACVRHGRTLVSGAASGMDGQVGVFSCDGDAPCYQCFLDGIGEHLGDCESQGILGPVTGVIGSLMAVEAIKLLTGLGEALSGRVIIYDGLNGAIKTLKLQRNPSCPACGVRDEA